MANIDITKIKFSSSKTQEPHQYQDQVNDCTRWRMQLPPPLNFVQVSCELELTASHYLCSKYSLGFCVTWTSCSGNKMSVKPHNPILYRLQDCLGPGVNIGDSEQFSISWEDNQWYILVKWSWRSHCVLHIVIHVILVHITPIPLSIDIDRAHLDFQTCIQTAATAASATQLFSFIDPWFQILKLNESNHYRRY